MPYVPMKEYNELKRIKAIHDRKQAELQESFRIKVQCESCGYQSMDHLVVCPLVDCDGRMERLTK